MLDDWEAMTREFSAQLRTVRAGTPEVMKGFSAVAQASLKAGALNTKTKELLSLGIAVAIRCDPCIAFHAESAVKHGATREEVLETISIAIYMGAGPSVMYAAKALEAFALAMLDEHLSHCVVRAAQAGGEEAESKIREASAAIARLVRS